MWLDGVRALERHHREGGKGRRLWDVCAPALSRSLRSLRCILLHTQHINIPGIKNQPNQAANQLISTGIIKSKNQPTNVPTTNPSTKSTNRQGNRPTDGGTDQYQPIPKPTGRPTRRKKQPTNRNDQPTEGANDCHPIPRAHQADKTGTHTTATRRPTTNFPCEAIHPHFTKTNQATNLPTADHITSII